MTTAVADAEPLRLDLGAGASVAALRLSPPDARAAFVFAHGAGAGMDHAFMAGFAAGLAARGVASLRFQFPFIEKGSRRTDPPAVAHATVRAAVAEAGRQWPGLALFAGGKSFGGRMSSQAQALAPLAGVRGLVFVGFPLHPAGKPGIERAAHLHEVTVPMLFLQGTRDELAELDLIRRTTAALPLATLAVVDDADHGFHVRAASGRRDPEAMVEMLDATAAWIGRIGPAPAA